jgi:hypothetical protein
VPHQPPRAERVLGVDADGHVVVHVGARVGERLEARRDADRRALPGQVARPGDDAPAGIDRTRRPDADARQVGLIDARVGARRAHRGDEREDHVLRAVGGRRRALGLADHLATPIHHHRLDLRAAEVQSADQAAPRWAHGPILT